MDKLQVSLYNRFHNTSTEVRKVTVIGGRLFLSDRIYRAARKRVCGQKECFCGSNDTWRVYDGESDIRYDLMVHDGKGLYAYELITR